MIWRYYGKRYFWYDNVIGWVYSRPERECSPSFKIPEKVANGENDRLTFTFVTDRVESAIEQAKRAAGDKDVTAIGGANIGQQLLKARLVDEIHVDILPFLTNFPIRLIIFGTVAGNVTGNSTGSSNLVEIRLGHNAS